MTDIPEVTLREWRSLGPNDPGGEPLRGLRLTEEDREIVRALESSSSVSFTELRDGLSIQVKQHVGTIRLSKLRVVIRPKLRIEHVMKLIAYTLGMNDLLLFSQQVRYGAAPLGMVDLLGQALLAEIERIVRAGLSPKYVEKLEDLGTPRGRIDMRHVATHPRHATLRCLHEELTLNHPLNQTLAAGARLAARLVETPDLSLDLGRAADRYFGDLDLLPLTAYGLSNLIESIDRRSEHYKDALSIIVLLLQNATLADHEAKGALHLTSFLVDMNILFERFLEVHLRAVAPPGYTIETQDIRKDVFRYTMNTARWRQPTIRPDLVVYRDGLPVIVADAKYKNRHQHPPSSAELYQLTIYGLSLDLPDPRTVLLLHPVVRGERTPSTQLHYAPPALGERVILKLVGVPLDDILDGKNPSWWPFG